MNLFVNFFETGRPGRHHAARVRSKDTHELDLAVHMSLDSYIRDDCPFDSFSTRKIAAELRHHRTAQDTPSMGIHYSAEVLCFPVSNASPPH